MTTHERAVEVDTELSALWQAEGDARSRIASSLQYLQHAVGDTRPGFWSYRDSNQFTTTTAQAEARAREQAAAGTLGLRHRSAVESTLRALDESREAAVAARELARPFEAEYEAERWPRFFLVRNTGGHVHSSMSCTTTFPTTEWAWLPQLSGLTEAEAVADQGPRLCSVCFPSAPVEWTLGLPKAPRCPGSGQQGERIGRTRYGVCPVCGDSYALSNTGAIRAHKPKEA